MIKIGGNFRKFLQKQFCTVFLRRCVFTRNQLEYNSGMALAAKYAPQLRPEVICLQAAAVFIKAFATVNSEAV